MQTAVQRNRERVGRLALGLALAATLGLGGPGQAEDWVPQTFGLEDKRGAFFPEKAVRPTPSESFGVSLDLVPQVALPEVDTKSLLRQDEEKARVSGEKVLRFGVGRNVQAGLQDGNWYQLDNGGSLWVLDVVSSGALGMRLHCADVQLPNGAQLAVYSPSALDDTGIKALEPGDRRVALYEAGHSRREFWSPTVTGERARVELYLPQGVAVESLPFTLDRLQHHYVDPVQKVMGGKAAGNCHNDVSCHSAWSGVALAVAGLGVAGFDSLFCTGQLINNFAQDFTPYFLTANHCLDSAFEAQDTEIFWGYQTATCGGTPPSLGSVPTSVGTTLVSTNPASDYTLLMIEGTLPNGLFWAGWNAGAIDNGTAATAIHHPSGDFKRISFGNKNGSSGCGGSGHVQIGWTDAPTEPGSSGSGIFRNDTQQLFGQLHCGPSACGNETNDDYGAFATTFPRIQTFMNGGSDDSSEPNDSCGAPRTAKKGTLTGRIVKYEDSDRYRIKVPKNKTLRVTLTFTHGNGDIDAKLYKTCGQTEVVHTNGSSNTEVIEYRNTGKTANFTWQVFLFSDTRNSYTMKVEIR
jgi:hypothetical protein